MYTCNKGSKYIPVTKVQVASNRPKRKKKNSGPYGYNSISWMLKISF